MADEVKLITFAGETVSPLYDGLIQELYTGGGGIITGAVVTIKDASTLHITGGYGALCGREFEIFASDIPVTLSSSGTLKGRLYLHMDLAQSGAPIELLVEVASSLTPVVQDSDVNTTNGVYEVNLATFDVGTSAISNLVDVSPKLSKIPDQISSLNSALQNYLKSLYSGKTIAYKGIAYKAGSNTVVNVLLPEPLGAFSSGGVVSVVAVGVGTLTLTGTQVQDANGFSFTVSNNLNIGQICTVNANLVWD